MFKKESKLFFWLPIIIFMVIPVWGWAAGLVLPNKPGTFAVVPARQEISLASGQTQTVNLRVANYLGRSATFVVGLEDLDAQTYGREGYVVSTTTKRYTFSSLALLGQREFLLANGTETTIPVKIFVPADWPPVSVAGLINLGPVSVDKNSGQAKVKTSAGVLFLVRVKGEAIEAGQLEKFGFIGSRWLTIGQPLKIQVVYKNTGNVYLNPYGLVTIKSFWSKKVSSRYLDPWFVLPQATRLREVSLDGFSWPGVYRAKLDLNLGFNNQVVTDSFYFFVMPTWWQWLIGVIIVIVVLRIILRKRRHV